LRSDEEFTKFYSQVLKSSEGLIDEPVLPRKQKIPRRIDDGADPPPFSDSSRNVQATVLDEVVNEINRRFDQENLKIVIDIENLLLSVLMINRLMYVFLIV